MRTTAILAALVAASLRPAAAEDKDKPAARLIPTKDLKITFPDKGDVREPAVITSADDLAKSPVVKDAADELKKQIDFTKEKLVVFAWAGLGKDAVGPTARKTEGGKTTVVITYTRGATKGSREHVFLYAIPKDAGVTVEVNSKVPKNAGEFASAPLAEDKPAVRALDLKGVKLVLPEMLTAPAPVEITSADDLAKSKAFADDAGRDAVKKQVDFAKEKLVVFAWAGSGQDKITPELKTADKKTTAVFTYKVGATDDFRRHGLVFAVPKDASVEVKK